MKSLHEILHGKLWKTFRGLPEFVLGPPPREILGPLHTRDWEHVTITLQQLSLVEKAELVQVRFTLRLRDQRSMWMQDRCKVHIDSCMASNDSCFMVTWTMFKKPPLGGRLNTKPGDHGTLNTHNNWFILFYHAWGPAWIEIHWNCIWLRAWSHMASHYTWGSVTTLLHNVGGCVGTAFGHSSFLGLTISWSWLLARVWSGP